MSFFELPRPTASAFRAVAVSPPAWLGPPHNVLPGIAPVELVIARTEETVVAIGGIDAYPEGFGFTLSLRLRTLSAREEQLRYLIDRAAYEVDAFRMRSCASACSPPTVARPPTSTALTTTRRGRRQIDRC